ncbi:MAG: MATE family efflux transporter [Phycisphaerales bacterium]|nr:MATE family efflux transporter [Phycisphaerales bacterium]
MTTPLTDDNSREDRFIAAGISPDDPMSALGATEIVDAQVEESGRIKSGKLAGKSMHEAIWILAIPILLQQTMAAGVGFVDKLIAGNLPHEIARSAMDGVGLGSFVGWFIGIAMAGLGVGGQVIISRSMGSGDRHEGERALGQSMLLSLAWGIFVAITMASIAEPLAQFSNLSPEGTRACVTYVQMLAWGIPFSGVMMVGAMCLHGAGETHKPFQIAVWVNVVNCIAAWLLSGVTIQAFGAEIPNPSPTDPYTWGVFGIALGSALSYVVGAWLTWRALRKGVQDLKLHASELRFDPVMTKRIALVGIPNFFEGLAMWSVNLFILGIIGEVAERGIGTASKDGLVGAHIITVQWEAFSFLPGFAMGTAAGALAGQYLGAGNAQLARAAIWRCTFIGMSIMVSAGIIFMLFGRALCSVISDDPIHLALVPDCLWVSGALQVFFALAMVVRNGLRGVGDTKWILGITLFGCYAIRLPLAWIFGINMGLGLVGIWWALMLEIAVRGLMFLIRFRYGAWEKIRV